MQHQSPFIKLFADKTVDDVVAGSDQSRFAAESSLASDLFLTRNFSASERAAYLNDVNKGLEKAGVLNPVDLIQDVVPGFSPAAVSGGAQDWTNTYDRQSADPYWNPGINGQHPIPYPGDRSQADSPDNGAELPAPYWNPGINGQHPIPYPGDRSQADSLDGETPPDWNPGINGQHPRQMPDNACDSQQVSGDWSNSKTDAAVAAGVGAAIGAGAGVDRLSLVRAALNNSNTLDDLVSIGSGTVQDTAGTITGDAKDTVIRTAGTVTDAAGTVTDALVGNASSFIGL